MSRCVHPVLRWFSAVGAVFEGLVFGRGSPDRGPLFIVGLPRAGTTLLYQTICHRFQVAYPPMLTNTLSFAPGLAAWLARNSMRSYQSDFASHYGMSQGWSSPGEGTMWNLWFDKHEHFASIDACPPRCRRAVAAMGQIERIGDAPVVVKNLRLNQYLLPLAELFPKAVFIIAVRQPRNVALSILNARYALLPHPTDFWSIRPREYPADEELSPAAQVAWQVHGLLADLTHDIDAIGTDRCRAIRYEDFCQTPEGVLTELRGWVETAGMHLTSHADIPPTFPLKTGQTKDLPAAAVAELEALLADLLPATSIDSLPCPYLTGKV